VRKVATRWGPTNAQAGWADREAEAQWGEKRPVEKERISGPWLGRKSGWTGWLQGQLGGK
jgi:hypothetical protein